MPVASLTNFTVPLNNQQSAGSQGLLMPKLKYRFRVTFLGLGVTQPTTELTKQVMDVTRPSVSFEEKKNRTKYAKQMLNSILVRLDPLIWDLTRYLEPLMRS